MARKTASHLAKRKEIEAAEAEEAAADGKKTTKKKAAKKTTTRTKRTKTKTVERKRLLWGVYSGSMKEEARFPYDQREDAEKKIEQLRARSTKKMYFIQPIKEVITDTPEPAEVKKKT